MAGYSESENFTYINNYQSEKPDNVQNKNTFRNQVTPHVVITIARELERFILDAEEDALKRLENLGTSHKSTT